MNKSDSFRIITFAWVIRSPCSFRNSSWNQQYILFKSVNNATRTPTARQVHEPHRPPIQAACLRSKYEEIYWNGFKSLTSVVVYCRFARIRHFEPQKGQYTTTEVDLRLFWALDIIRYQLTIFTIRSLIQFFIFRINKRTHRLYGLQ